MKLHIKLIAVLLCIATLMVYLPIAVFADAFDFSSEDTETGEMSAETSATIQDTENVFEVAELREETVKHFHLDDGTYVAAQYAKPVHYQDEDGTWLDIDNTLSESGSEISTSNARIKFAKKITGNESLFTLHDGNYKMTWGLDGAIKKTVGTATNTQTQHDETATALQKLMTLDKLTSRVLYADILDGVDLEYVIDSYDVKENIIVKEKKDAYSYTFNMKLNNLTAELNEAGDVIILDSKTGAKMYVIAAPTAYDASGTYASSEDVSYTFVDGGNGKYTLTVTASTEWMNSAERAFPVTIDPPVSVLQSNCVDLYITSIAANNIYNNLSTIWVSNNSCGYWRANVLPDIPSSAYIVGAYLSYYQYEPALGIVGAYRIQSDWPDDLTWNEMTSGAGTVSNDLVDIAGSEERALPCYTWDITRIVTEWYDGEPNYGIGLKYMGANANGEIFFSSLDLTGPPPAFIIRYKDMKGLESYWSYTSQDVGLAGTGHVNNATGQLTVVKPLMSTTDSLFPFTPTLVYNSALANMEVEYPNAEMSYSGTYTSRGFKLNIQETIIKKQFFDTNDLSRNMYILSDADGTEHYFIPVFNEYGLETGQYRDEDGLQLALDVTNENSYLTITDTNQTVRTYTKLSGTPSSEVLGGWYLTSIADRYGNKIIFTFNTSKNPTAISLLPNGQSQAITFLQIAYTDNYLPCVILNPNSGEAVLMKYSATPGGTITSTGGQYLRTITYAHSTSDMDIDEWEAYWGNSSVTTNVIIDGSASYSYSSASGTKGYITKLTDGASGLSVEYTVTSTGKISSANERGTNSSMGQKISFSYGTNCTVITSSGTDDVFGTADDILTTYVFDTEGRQTSAYSQENGQYILSAASNEYETLDLVKNNLAPTFSVSDSTTNYLLNGNFDSSTPFEYWTKTSNVMSGGSAAPYSKITRCAKIMPQQDSVDRITQYTRLPSGTYTLSAAVKSVECDNVSIILRATSLNGNGSFEEKVAVSALESVNGNTVISLTVNSTTGSSVIIGDEFKIEIEVVANGAVSANSRVEISDVLLEKRVGHGFFSVVEMGSFDDFSIDAQKNSVSLVGTFWQDQSSNAIVPAYSATPFGKTGFITGDPTATKYLVQTIELPYYTSVFGWPYGPIEFVVSGYAKAIGPTVPAGEFRLRIEVDYYGIDEASLNGNDNEDDDIKYIYDFDFLDNSSGWQYISKNFSTESYPVQSIKLYCEFSHQPTGTEAYFDNISLIMGDEITRTQNTYDENTGRLIHTKTGTYEESYKYNDKNQVVMIANNCGELVDYEYKSDGVTLNKETHYTFAYETDIHTYRWWLDYDDSADTSADDGITKTAKKIIEYVTNAYGQTEEQKVWSRGENDEADVCSVLTSYVEYRYNDLPGNYIFGSLAYEIVNYEYANHYYYDFTNGRLLAALRCPIDSVGNVLTSQSTGTCYTYDGLGNITSVLPATFGTNDYVPTANAEEVEYTYNALGQLASISTASTTYNFSYNSFGNTQMISVDDQAIAAYAYNSSNGKLHSIGYTNGTIVRYVYDSVDNLSQIWYNTGGGDTLAYEYTYSSSNQLIRVDDFILGTRTVYKYDKANRLVRYIVSNIGSDTDSPVETFSIDNTYDTMSRLSASKYYLDIVSTDDSDTQQHSTIWSPTYYEYNTDNSLHSLTTTVSDLIEDFVEAQINYTYDSLDRAATKNLDLIYGEKNVSVDATYTYAPGRMDDFIEAVDYTSGRIGSYTASVSSSETTRTYGYSYEYSYDHNGNITNVFVDGTEKYRYVYDDLGQLIREDNGQRNKTYLYVYDNAGNILSKQECALTAAGVTPTPTTTHTYTYDLNWGDQLKWYDGQPITYDGIGNPLTYYNGSTYTFTWSQGRRLASAAVGTYNLTYKYNSDGIRTSKIVDGVEHIYTLDGTKILTEAWGDHLNIYLYDESDSPIGFLYRNSSYAENEFDTYIYEKNLQGDIVTVYNEEGRKLIIYSYDAWGNVSQRYFSGGQGTSVVYNPFKYRGYYHDSETGFYYLNSRYYDPNTCRFINADKFLSQFSEIGNNLFAYCCNNPVMFSDTLGCMPEWLGWTISAVSVASGIFLCATGVGGILGGVLIASGTNSLINGYVTKAAGGDFTAGYIGGTISGALCGAGAGLGGIAFSAASETINFSSIGYMALGVGASFVGGAAGNFAGTIYTNWHNSGFTTINIDWKETIAESMFLGSLNVFAGMGSGMSSLAGQMSRAAADTSEMLAFGIFAGVLAGGTEAIYDLISLLMSNLISLFEQ